MWPRPGMGMGGRGATKAGVEADEEVEEEDEEEGGWVGALWEGATGSWFGCCRGLPPLRWRDEGPCCRLRMLSMAHCRCSVSVSSGGLPLEKLALSMSGESDLQRLAGSEEGSRVGEASGEGGPGACWSMRYTAPGRCRWLLPLARL